MKKKGLLLILALVLLTVLPTMALAAEVYVNGQRLDISTYTESGTTLVPLRAIFQALGATVEWDGTTQTVTAIKEETTVKLQIGSQAAIRNGKPVTLQVPAKIIDGSTMVPLRFVSESLGAYVAWDGVHKVVTVNSGKNDITSDAIFNQDTSTTSGNAQGRGIANIKGDWIYYCNWSDGGNLYKVRLDGTGKTKLNDMPSLNINIVGDWIYYNLTKYEGNTIYWTMDLYKIKLDGSQNQLLNSSGNVNMQIVDDWIYYRLDGLYKMKTDCSEEILLDDSEAAHICVEGDWIYYVVSGEMFGYGKIYKIRTDGTEKQLVCDDQTNFMDVDGDWIYYVNNSDGGKIYKIKTDGTSKTKLNDCWSGDINVSGGWVYYTNVEDNGSIYKMKPDGGNQTLVNKQYASFFCVCKDWIYYYNGEQAKIYRVKNDGSNRELVD